MEISMEKKCFKKKLFPLLIIVIQKIRGILLTLLKFLLNDFYNQSDEIYKKNLVMSKD